MDNLPTDPRLYDTDHPTIVEAVAWLTGTDTVAVTRRHAETLLPHWEHYGALTEREREAILARFPRVIHSSCRVSVTAAPCGRAGAAGM